MKKHDIPPKSSLDLPSLSRRGLFALGGLGLLGFALGGDNRPDKREIPRGRYRKIAALGDSFTAGLGASNPEHGYAALVAQMLEAESFINIAHDGWSADDVLKGRDDIPSQIERLPSDTDLVLATVGGNAINLREFGKACLTDGCEPGTPAFTLATSVFRSDEYYDTLEQVYRAMLAKAPNATIAIVGYPKPVTPAPEFLHTIAGFMKLFGKTVRTSALGEANDEAMANVVDMLDEATRVVMRRIGDPRLIYLEAPQGISLVDTGVGSLIGGGALPEFHSDLDSGSDDSGHPNNLGYKTMAETIVWQLSVPADTDSNRNEAASRR